MNLTALERDFINEFQGGFPVNERPFQLVAKTLKSTEDEIIKTVNQLRQQRYLSRFGPLYDAAQLGGGLTLAALSVPEDRYEIITEMVNAYPEVAHNYRREHKLNMWFVLATEKPQEVNSIIQSIEYVTRLKVYNFPKQHEFYIGLWLRLSADGRNTTVPVPHQASSEKSADAEIDTIDRKIISVTQTGLPVIPAPYEKIASNIGTTQNVVLARMQRLLDTGIIRRIGAVPNHYKLGLLANGMTVWDVDDTHLTALGELVGQLDFVSHCYQRPRHLPVWRYNFFAMVHGHDRDEVARKVEKIDVLLGNSCHAHETLFSSAILKKTGLRLAA